MKYELVVSLFFCSAIFFSVLTPVQTQIPETPEFDGKQYFGMEFGTTGILNVLMDVVELEEFPLDLLPLINFTLEQIWKDRMVINGSYFPTWPKSNDDYSFIYPGQKYGPAGIFLTFLRMYEATGNIIWLDRAEQGYWSLALQAINETTFPRWPYTYNLPKDNRGISTTDLKYGIGGILNFNMELYQLTLNNSYLDHGRLLISSLKEYSVNLVVNNKDYEVIPWFYPYSANTYSIMTGYNWGLAGLAPLLYRYGSLLQDDDIKNWAINLGDFLKAVQLQDGSWNNEYDGLTKKSSFDDGVAGVIYGLYELELLSNQFYSTSITSGINWLFSKYVSNQSHKGFFTDDFDNKIFNGLYNGLLGVLKSFTTLKVYLKGDQINTIQSLFQWILTNGSFVIKENDVELLIMFHSPVNYEFIDVSFAEGQAGLLSELIRLKNTDSIFLNKQDLGINRVVEAITNSLLYFQDDYGYWNKQIKINSDWSFYRYTLVPKAVTTDAFNILEIILTVIILSVFQKRRKRKKLPR